ncbi:MAG: beta galactosidase jelly roll domain-containing protein [Armatimonadetes bacterium]|nr:beta galactosidase jelly roll domain-containing protein [Armatimonadota bacterium]
MKATAVEADTPLDRFDALLIGRRAIRLDNKLPDLRPLLDRGRRVLVMEQTEPALTQRLGFRVNDPSLRRVFVRVPSHPVLAGLDTDRLRDWRGEATLLPGKLDLPTWEPSDPPHDWLGFANTRVWKCGNTGQVATVVVEKPQRGDFEALVDGGFDLEYAPLLLHRAGNGQVLFCQIDVTARSVPDPAADRLHANLLAWVSAPADKAPAGPARYVGDDSGAALLTGLGVAFRRVDALEAAGPGLLIAGPGCGKTLAGVSQAVAGAVRAGGELFCLPLPAEDLGGWLPIRVETSEASLLAASAAGELSGVGPSELHWRGRKKVLRVAAAGGQPAVVSRVAVDKGAVTFCQVSPADWDYDDPYRVYLKRTADRTATLLARLLAKAGVTFSVPLREDWSTAVPPVVDLAGPWQAAPDPDGSLTPGTLDQAKRWWTLQAPGLWEDQAEDAKGYDGVVWYRRTFEWRGPADQPATLRLGAIDDEDWTWLNGTMVGHTGQDTHPTDYWSHDRVYALPAGTLRAGTNRLVVKVRDLRQGGGIARGPLMVVLPPRWLSSYYLDVPAQLDDPYRYNRW